MSQCNQQQCREAATQFEVYVDQASEFRWRLRHQNGNILADSGEGYSSRQGCVDGITSVKTALRQFHEPDLVNE